MKTFIVVIENWRKNGDVGVRVAAAVEVGCSLTDRRCRWPGVLPSDGDAALHAAQAAAAYHPRFSNIGRKENVQTADFSA